MINIGVTRETLKHMTFMEMEKCLSDHVIREAKKFHDRKMKMKRRALGQSFDENEGESQSFECNVNAEFNKISTKSTHKEQKRAEETLEKPRQPRRVMIDVDGVETHVYSRNSPILHQEDQPAPVQDKPRPQDDDEYGAAHGAGELDDEDEDHVDAGSPGDLDEDQAKGEEEKEQDEEGEEEDEDQAEGEKEDEHQVEEDEEEDKNPGNQPVPQVEKEETQEPQDSPPDSMYMPESGDAGGISKKELESLRRKAEEDHQKYLASQKKNKSSGFKFSWRLKK